MLAIDEVPKLKQIRHQAPWRYFITHETGFVKIYPYAKFEVSSFTHSKFPEGVLKLKNLAPGPWHTHPVWGNFVIHEMNTPNLKFLTLLVPNLGKGFKI